ncbi:hypothetical protein RVX78_004618 [Enterobacter cloacae]|nr:hypothetical protein [Enterobacter cloacae]
MAISEKDLLEAGFSKSEVGNLQGRLAAGGGTMQHLIDALSRRFRVSVWITVALGWKAFRLQKTISRKAQ